MTTSACYLEAKVKLGHNLMPSSHDNLSMLSRISKYFTGSYQAFEQPPAKSIKWCLLGQKKKKLKINLLDM
jgi:hypothetical protein